MIDPERFKAEATAFHEKMLATLMTRKLLAYDGRIAGVDCIVVGFCRDQANPRNEAVPLAIVITPEVFEVLEVNATKVRP